MDELLNILHEFESFRLRAATKGLEDKRVAFLDARLDATLKALGALMQLVPEPGAPWAVVVVALERWRQTIAEWHKKMARIDERAAASQLA